MKRKISVTTGTRAEYGILRPVIKSILQSKKLELYLVVTGTHLSKKHGFTINEIKKDGFKIFKTINMIPKKDTAYFMSKTLGEGIIAFSNIFSQIQPHINLVLGDRDEMLASAIAAYHMNIPNAHIHGGDKSGGIDEYTRHAITKISNIHFAATKKSKNRIIKMGENPKYVFLTGSPSLDEVINNNITKKIDLEKFYGFKFSGNEILLLQHPTTTESEHSEKQISNILKAIVNLRITTIAIAPNSDAGNKTIFDYLKSYSKKYDFIKFYTSLPRRDFLGMLHNCGVLVGNSSSGIIEASYFRIPVVNIGIRQKGREKNSTIFDVKDVTVKSIQNMILKALKTKRPGFTIGTNVYGNGNASKKIVQYLEQIPLNKDLIQKQIFY
ncbi:MAG: UDP-N-acetylglucosamine 2-epimerase (hydrolyzing) [Thaumarchaeota archaeon]|nr:MAG: UDP-N-acetylglucosamine 2-epimerase (hydrolyzing) [Nitrososphaerota archaeon]